MEKVFNSKDIAEVLEKRHDNLLRAIRNYRTALGEDADKYFIPEGDGRKAFFKVTYLGCELLAGRMIGHAGEEFKSWYKSALGEPVEDPVPEEPKEKLYTVAEAVEMLGMSERSVYRNIQIGKLESVEREIMVPTVKKFITAEALEKFKAEREG